MRNKFFRNHCIQVNAKIDFEPDRNRPNPAIPLRDD